MTLIHKVSTDPEDIGTLGWHGPHYKPGARVSEAELLEICGGDPETKCVLLLELVDVEDEAGFKFGRRKWRLQLNLWRWRCVRDSKRPHDPPLKYWGLIASAQAPAGDAALRLMAAGLLGHDDVTESDSDASERITTWLQKELRSLGKQTRTAVTERILHQLVAIVVAEREKVLLAVPRTKEVLAGIRQELASICDELAYIPKKPNARVLTIRRDETLEWPIPAVSKF